MSSLSTSLWSLFEEQIFPVSSTPELFNPYNGEHPELDRPGAAAIRRANLRGYLNAYTEAPQLFLLLEAPGPWGCRFSGVPITSENHLLDSDFPLSGEATGITNEPHTEYCAGIFWRVLKEHFPSFFVWNSVPFHPHDEGEPLTIRTPRRTEVRAYSSFLADMLAIIKPARVLAIGRKAEQALGDVDVDCTYVRHPSHGGAKKFERGVLEALQAMQEPC